VATLALLLQLVPAVGHTHSDHDTKIGATIETPAESGRAAMPRQGGDRDDDGSCALCAIAVLLAGARTAAAPFVAAPIVPADAATWLDFEPVPVKARRSSFQSRAPPLA
jgi:hypothetical protein